MNHTRETDRLQADGSEQAIPLSKNGFTLIFVALLLSSTGYVPAQVASQKGQEPFVFDPSRQVRVGNQAITAGVERTTGQFWIETSRGVPLLFARNSGLTSFTNIRFEGATYTNNDLRSPQTPPFTVRMPYGSTLTHPDRLVFSTSINARGRRLDIWQHFIPSLDSTYAFVQIRTVLRNSSAMPIKAGMQLMYDLFLDATDLVDVEVDGMPVIVESGWDGQRVPDAWEGTTSGSPVHIVGRLGHPGLVKPDKFIVGRWQYNGYLGAAAWNYLPSGLRFWDNAVLMQWNEHVIPPGDSVVIATDYGYTALFESRLSCEADRISLAPDEASYQPNPFAVRALIVNTGSIAIPSCTVGLTLPAGASFPPGETVFKSTSTPLFPGDTARIPWMVLVAVVDSGGSLDFGIDLVDPALLRQHCNVRVALPAIPKYTADVLCQDTIMTVLTPDGRDYTPNPLTITAEITNTGTAPLSALSAVITLPAELVLQGGGPSVPVTPDPLLTGQKGTASWLVRAAPQYSDTVVDYTVSIVFRQKIITSCNGHALLRQVTHEQPCTESNLTTRGTEFWTMFLPNDGGSSPVELVLYIAATEDTKVRIEQSLTGRTDDLYLRAGTLRSFTVDSQLDNMTPELVQRLGIHVTSDKPVAVYSASLSTRHSDASIVLPVHSLGREYATVGYNYEDPEEHFAVMATENGTTVTIDPFSLTSRQRPPRVPFTVSLNQGETYYVLAGVVGRFGGLTGSLVTADKPVAVLSGGHTGWIPENGRSFYGYLNPHFDQIIPDSLLGTEYITVPFRARLGGDTFKAVALHDSTTIMIGPVPRVTLTQRGDRVEFMLDAPSRVWSDKPFLLAQFANSATWDRLDSTMHYADASMVILSPTDRMSQCHMFPLHPETDTSTVVRFADSFVNLVVPDGGEKSVTLNGAAVPDTAFHPVPFSSFRFAQVAVTDTMGMVGTSDPRGIGAIVYGFEYHDAFTVNSGFVVARKNGVTSVRDVPSARNVLLEPVVPNPVVDVVTVRYSLPGRTRVKLAVYSLVGAQVLTLEDGIREAGMHAFHLRAAWLPTGHYRVVLETPDGVQSRPIVVMR